MCRISRAAKPIDPPDGAAIGTLARAACSLVLRYELGIRASVRLHRARQQRLLCVNCWACAAALAGDTGTVGTTSQRFPVADDGFASHKVVR
jgi:hypothetical protein